MGKITAGTKTAKIVSGKFIESPKTKTMGIEVVFSFEEQETGSRETLSWVAWLTDKAKERSMETLVDVLGYNGSEAVNDKGIFTDKNAFDFGSEVSLEVELEARLDADGNQKFKDGEPIFDARVKWVNRLGGSGFIGIQPEVLKSKLAGLGFRGLFLSAQKNSGRPKQQAPAAAAGGPGVDSNEPLPF